MTTPIIFSKRFLKDAKKLRKKYPNIDKDLWDFSTNIENGEIIGDKLKSVGGLAVYKSRVKNSSIKSGKSGGFRIIYYVELENTKYELFLIPNWRLKMKV
ncbi:MAG: type II toxin-antitoxin system RelE/ParE family toxin [Pseudomonadota bacterium]